MPERTDRKRDQKGKAGGPQPPPNWNWQTLAANLLFYLAATLFLLWVWQDLIQGMTVRTIAYSEFKEHLRRGEVVECSVHEDVIVGRIQPGADSERQVRKQSKRQSRQRPGQQADEGLPRPDSKPAEATEPDRLGQTTAKGDANSFLFRTVRVEDPELIKELEEAGVRFSGVRPSMISQLLWAWVIPIGLILLLWALLWRRFGSAGQSLLSIGRSRARLVADRDTGVTFDDVAGCDEAKFELQEVVDFVKHPERYRSLGAKIPKGVLLVGPPGTGKTLLARAVAGEAKVPFFSISGSEFVEMFVGVGAARVRDLFEQAKRHAPCIIFIDEIDAIGRQRGVHVGVANDEREQTLNQLLVEMDGFDPNAGVVVLAATNRPEILDRALLRPGRFDRQVVVDAPDLNGREAILKVHARGKPLAPDVDLRRIAQATPGFSGADLANVLNEAALLAARRGSKLITQRDLEEGIEKVIAGPERKSRRLSEEERRRVAYHEVGHALVAAFSEHGEQVLKISIVPRGRAALGYTFQLPTEERFLMTRSELLDRIKGLLGGRAAEELVFGEVSTGAENDLERATALARQMVCIYGMSDAVGLTHCAQRDGSFLGTNARGLQRDCSEQTAREIDEEVRKLLDEAYRQAKQIIDQQRERLEQISAKLLEQETIDGDTFYRLCGRSELKVEG